MVTGEQRVDGDLEWSRYQGSLIAPVKGRVHDATYRDIHSLWSTPHGLGHYHEMSRIVARGSFSSWDTSLVIRIATKLKAIQFSIHKLTLTIIS